MRRLMTALFCVSLCLGAAGFLRAGGVEDRVVLKDGRVFRGQVVEESRGSITLQIKGRTRVFKRDRVKRVVYGSGPAAVAPPAGGGAAAAAAAPAADRLALDISRRYRVPLSEVQWVRRQGISESDLPIVFFVAASASIRPGPVVRLRLNGLSWKEIENHYGLNRTRVYYQPAPWVAYPTWGVGLGWGWNGGYGDWGGWRHDDDDDGWGGCRR